MFLRLLSLFVAGTATADASSNFTADRGAPRGMPCQSSGIDGGIGGRSCSRIRRSSRSIRLRSSRRTGRANPSGIFAFFIAIKLDAHGVVPLVAGVTANHKAAIAWTTAEAVPSAFILDGIDKSRLLGEGERNVLRLDQKSFEIRLIVGHRLARKRPEGTSGTLLPLLCTVHYGLDHSNALLFWESESALFVKVDALLDVVIAWFLREDGQHSERPRHTAKCVHELLDISQLGYSELCCLLGHGDHWKRDTTVDLRPSRFGLLFGRWNENRQSNQDTPMTEKSLERVFASLFVLDVL